MSVLKLDAAQFGDNADATKNFTLRTNNNGTMTLARGNVGATTQDLLTIDANGRIAVPQNRYVSGNQPITSAGALTLPHGLGSEPKQLFFYLKCLATDGGFTVGQKVVAQMQLSNSIEDNKGLTVAVDATNISIRFGSNAAVFSVVNFSTGAGTGLANASWALVVEASA